MSYFATIMITNRIMYLLFLSPSVFLAQKLYKYLSFIYFKHSQATVLTLLIPF